MKEKFCFWSIATGPRAGRAQSLVDSARAVGVFKDFHIWTNRPVDGAICHRLQRPQAVGRLVELRLLEEQARKLNYDYLVWLDAGTCFVRNPGNVLRVMHGGPIHASLDCDAALPARSHLDWRRCSLSNFTKLMRFRGVRSHGVFTVDDGFWIVHREAIDTFCDLAWNFWDFCKRAGYTFGFEPLLAYAAQMLCGNPYVHTLKNTADLWAVHRTGVYPGVDGEGVPWEYANSHSDESFTVNPAMVRVLPGGQALRARAKISTRLRA